MVKALPELYAFPLLKTKSFERCLLFNKIATNLQKFCACRNKHITTDFIRQRWQSLFAHFRRDNSRNVHFGIPFGKWRHFEELMFLQPHLNCRGKKPKATAAVKPKRTNSFEVNTPVVETMEIDDLDDSVDTFFAFMAEQAKRLSHVQKLNLQLRCRKAFFEIEAGNNST